jgi:hypothetical protein
MTAPLSLCQSCSFKRDVRGRHEQRYLLCRNEAIDTKYPPQPVLACAGYRPLLPEHHLGRLDENGDVIAG